MRTLKAKQLLVFSTSKPALIQMDTPLKVIVEKIVEDRATREVYVMDDVGHFFGVITLRRLARFVFMHEVQDTSSATELLEMASAQTARDLALKKAAHVSEDDSLEHVINVMFRFDINEIPVVDSNLTIVGCLNMLEILAAWRDGRLDQLD